MGWIKKRIEAERRKHGSMPQGLEKFNLDWERLAEIKIIASIMNYSWKNNTILMSDLHNLECECGHSLFEHKDFDLMDKISKGCNNKFCICLSGFKAKKMNPNLRLATTDGGWVNVLKLHNFLDGKSNEVKKL